MAVVVVVIGVGVCTVTDVKVNIKGFICACLAVLSTSLQQIVSIYCFPSSIVRRCHISAAIMSSKLLLSMTAFVVLGRGLLVRARLMFLTEVIDC